MPQILICYLTSNSLNKIDQYFMAHKLKLKLHYHGDIFQFKEASRCQSLDDDK